MPTTMSPAMSPGSTPYMTPDEAALFLRLSRRTLDNLRSLGAGPQFRRHGGRVFYHRQDVENWSARVSTTAEARARLLAQKPCKLRDPNQLELPFDPLPCAFDRRSS
jgi:Helix-turn-helix domain